MRNILLLYTSLCLIAPLLLFAQVGRQSTNLDLKITFTNGEPHVSPGEKVDLEVAVFQVNGNAPQQDIRVDLALVSKRSYKIPAPLAVYGTEFSEGVLLKGGRSFCTVPAVGMVTKTMAGTLPPDLPAGKYYLAAVIDAGNDVQERDEYNNVDYLAIEVKQGAAQPVEVLYKDFSSVLNSFEVYMAGESKNKSQIFWAKDKENSLQGNVSPVYQPKAIEASALAFSPKEELYFLDRSKFDIYRSNGDLEEKVYTHHTYIKDVVFDKQGNLYFSEASGGGGNGTIYKFNSTKKRATKYLTVPLNQVDGFWTGDFAFSPTNQLYISSGNTVPASLYKFEKNKFEKVYTNANSSISGFFFLNEREVIFSDQGKEIFFLRNFSEKARAMETESIERIEDVWLLPKPPAGTESIRVQLKDGEGIWSLTNVYLRGPNLYWRVAEDGYSQQVGTSGTAQFSKLPSGLYWLRTDIRADLGWGFRPKQQMVTCQGAPVSVAFYKP